VLCDDRELMYQASGCLQSHRARSGEPRGGEADGVVDAADDGEAMDGAEKLERRVLTVSSVEVRQFVAARSRRGGDHLEPARRGARSGHAPLRGDPVLAAFGDDRTGRAPRTARHLGSEYLTRARSRRSGTNSCFLSVDDFRRAEQPSAPRSRPFPPPLPFGRSSPWSGV